MLAPTSVMDCFWTTIDAFNLAEEFQLPVIVLQDTVLAVRTESIPQPDLSQGQCRQSPHVRVSRRRVTARSPATTPTSGPERYLRYQITAGRRLADGHPGTLGGAYVATGLEHTQAANTSSDARNHSAMTEKRFRKLDGAVEKAPPAHEYGDPSAEIGFLTWGSTLGVVAEAIDRLGAQGHQGPRAGAAHGVAAADASDRRRS